MDNENLVWRNEQRTVDELIPWDKNPRQMSADEMQRLEKSLTKFNPVEIPAIDTDGKIIAGHMRLLAMKRLGRGAEVVDVRVPNRKLTDEEFAEYNLISNKVHGDWDLDVLANSFDPNLLIEVGFTDEQIGLRRDGDVEDDFDPTPPEEPKSRLGDLYILGEHRLLCGDATKIEDLERLMDSAKADMVFTDPPYGVNYQGGTEDKLTIQNDNLDTSALSRFLDQSFEVGFSHLKPGGAFYVAGPAGFPFTTCFSDSLRSRGWRHTLAWVKQTFAMGRADYHYRHELLFYGWKDGASHYFTEDRTQDTVWESEPTDKELLAWARKQLEFTDVWKFNKPAKNTEHPTMKPIELVMRAVINSSKPKEIVLDFFGGSGSTIVACEQALRRCYMLELDPKYCDVIVARWEKLTGEKAVKV